MSYSYRIYFRCNFIGAYDNIMFNIIFWTLFVTGAVIYGKRLIYRK